MNKTLLTIFCVLATLCGMAQTETTFSEQYVIIVNGTSEEPKDGEETIVNNGDGTVNFVLKDFVLGLNVMGTSYQIPVGNVSMDNLTAWEDEEDGLLHFSGKTLFTLPTTSLPTQLQTMVLMGVLNLTDIPVALEGKMSDVKLYGVMDIYAAQEITVVIGTDDFPVPPVTRLYTEQLLVTINGETGEPQMTDVTVYDHGDGTIDFELKNFELAAGGESLPVGTIYVADLPVTKGEDGLNYFSYDGTIFIQPGDTEGDWWGPILGEIPISLQGKMNEEKLYVTIDIDMQGSLGQLIFVQLGTDEFGRPATVRNYTEPCYVAVMQEQSSAHITDVEVLEYEDATIDFTIKDLLIEGGEFSIPVGDLTLHSLETTADANGRIHFSGKRSISIPTDKLPDGTEIQAAAMLGAFNDIPTTIEGWYDEQKVFAEINAEKNVMGYNIALRVLIGPEKGDVNCDGTVNIADAVTVLNAMAGQTVSGIADVNGDKIVNIADFVTVLNIMAGQ